MRAIEFVPDAWDAYLYWQSQDRKTLKRINALIQDAAREPFAGLGKPEPLRGNLSGYWSRRITTPTVWSIARPSRPWSSWPAGSITRTEAPGAFNKDRSQRMAMEQQGFAWEPGDSGQPKDGP